MSIPVVLVVGVTVSVGLLAFAHWLRTHFNL